ncbi:MAG: hypothetical protein DMG13_22650 [Acidobacteria bacterium]|nr:MAG: hypothetical protein DMG13_22650 [Acidobacteriota bacterium]
MNVRSVFLLILLNVLPTEVSAQSPPEPGRHEFETRCSVCHGGDGFGSALGPAIVNRVPQRTDDELSKLIREGLPTRGMPPTSLNAQDALSLISYIRTLRPNAPAPVRRSVSLVNGKLLEGAVLNQSSIDVQLRTDDRKVHLLRATSDGYREVTSQTDWPSYNGELNGNRFTRLTQISKANVSRLAAQWTFTMEGAARAETTPVVVQGIMYITSANECWALDAGTGRQIWHYQRPRTKNLVGNAAQGFNRGVAWAGDRVFMVTDHAHLIALDRFTGELQWETEMADWRQNYNATSAPLAVGNLVISGTAGGEQGARGFVAAFEQSTGKEVWRTWTVPLPGEPGSETWIGSAIEHPAAVTWFTGTYDSELDLVYWPTGNPGPDYNGDERRGDNLYSNSILALDARTGRMRWYYQFTPHDVYDWDATEPPVLVDANWRGKPRKLLIQANRNGFFYVLDRVNGKLLLATPFLNKLTWAKEIGADGRPVLNPPETAGGGVKVCPSQDGATNWYSTAYDPSQGLYFVQTLEKCSIYYQRPTDWQAGLSYLGGSQRNLTGEAAQKILRALDIQTGKTVWSLPQVGPANSWGGVLATESGLVFFVDESGMFVAADSSTGQPLWRFQTNQVIKASPMTYMFDNRQHIAIVAGQTVLAFAVN